MIDQNLLQNTSNLSDIQNNYVMGGPGPSYANSVLDKYMGPKAAPSNRGVPTQANTPLADTPNGPRFPYYYPSAGIAGNEEAYAQGQSWYSKAFNATTKGVGLAGTTFLEGTVGMVIGTANAVADGKFSSFYDNPFSRSLDDFNKAAENKLPNYYTQEESNAEAWSPKNWYTANFLFDKVIKNMGFAVGAILAGKTNASMLNSLGLFTKVASAGGLAEAANMTEEAIASVQAGQRAGAIESGMKGVAQKFLTSYNVLNKAQRAITAGLGTMGEASFEAIQSSKEFRTKLIQDYIDRTGLEPRGDDLQKINDTAERAGNTTFGLNVALLSVTNYLQWPKIIGSSYAAERKLFADTAEEIGDLVLKDGKYVSAYEAKNLAGKALYKAKNVASLFFSPSEAFEEGAQTAIQHGTANYFNKAYNDGNGGSPDIINDLLGEGARYSLTSKEGLESILIGGLSGGIMEAVGKNGAIKERGLTGTGGHMAVNTAAAIDAFNKHTFSGYLKDSLESVNRGTVLQQQRAESIRRGDFQEARDLEYDYGHNYLAPRIKYGRFDMVMGDIDTQRQLSSSDEGMAQLRADGIIDNTTTPEEYRARLANIESHARSMALMYQSLNTRYAGMRNKEGERTHPDEVIDKMVYAASKVADYDKRSAALSAQIMAAGVDVSPLLSNITENGTIKVEDATGIMEQINNMDVISETKDILREQVRDLAEIGLRRKSFIREYDRIKKNPSSFKDQELIPSDASTVPIPQLNEEGRYDRRQFDLGKTYATTDPFLREGNNIVVRPTATLHERNALGEVRATVPTGETKFIQPKDLRGYNFADKSPYNEDLTNTTFQKSLDSVLSRKGIDKPEGTLQEQLNALNTPENTELMDAIEAAFNRDLEILNKAQEEIDALERDAAKKKAQEDAFNQMAAEAGTVATGSLLEDRALIAQSIAEEGNKKTADRLFISTTSPDTSKGGTENDDFHRRANKFLNNISEIENPHEVKTILVTKNNQDSLGLSGFIAGNTDDSADEAVIRAVFVRSNAKGDVFVDDKGEKLETVGNKPDFNRLVYSTMPNTSINWREGQPRYITTGPKAITELQAIALAASWKIARADILAQTDYKLYDFSISRGIPNTKDINARNPVTENLVNQRDLDSPIIQIPTQTTEPGSKVSNLVIGDNVYAYPVGRPVLVNGATVAYLNNRKLTDNEKIVIRKAIIELTKDVNNKPIRDYLKGTLFWGRPKGTPSSNQIWYDSGKLYMGAVDNFVAFTPSIVAASSELDTFLNNAYLNTNNFLLKQNGVYDEITDIADDGSLTQVQWRSYQHYLLSPIYETSEFDSSGLSGKSRESIPLTTNISSLDSTDQYASPFEQKYATLSGLDVSIPKSTTQAPASSVAPVVGQVDTTDQDIAPITQAGQYVLDGTTLNPINRNGKVPVEVAVTSTPDGLVFNEVKWNIPDDVPQEAREALLAIVKSDISQAIIDEIANKKSNVTPTPETRPATMVTPPSTPSDPKVEATPPEESPTPIVKAGKMTLDGKTLNPINRNGKIPLSVAAVVGENGQVEITDVHWNIPGDVPQEARDALMSFALSEIGESIIGEMQQREKTEQKATSEDAPKTMPNKPSESILKNLRPPSASSDFRMASFGTYQIEDVPAFTAYMKEVLPQIPVHNLQNMIEMTGNGYAFGVFRDNAIYLYEKAEIGTGYHEAFEAVYNAFLTNREQTALKAEFNRRPGTFIDRETGKTIPYHEANAHQAKEQMAEEFRDFKLSGTMFTPKETNFFRKLIGMIREFISGNTINKVFKKLNTGYYADKPTLQRRVDPQYRPAGFSTAFFREVMEGMTVRMFQELFKDNRNIVAFDEENPKSTEVYDKIYKNFEDLYENDIKYELNRVLTEMNASPETQEAEWGEFNKLHDEVWGSIKANWKDFVKEHKDFLKPFSVIFTQEENDNEVVEKENDINNDDKSNVEYERDILKIDAKKNASTAVKLLFATLTDVVPLKTPINADETLNRPDEKLGATKLPKTVRYASVFNKFLHEVANTNGLTNILAKTKALAVKDQRFIRLYSRLRGNNNYQNLSIDDWKLLMKVYSTASKQKPDYMIQVTDDTGNTYIQNANDNIQTRILIRSWLNNMKGAARKGELLYIDDGVYKINIDEVRKYQVAKSAEDRFRFVSDIGFTFTKEMYNNLPGYDRNTFNDAVLSIHAQLLKSGEIGTMTNQSLGISGGMNKLAELAVKTTGDDTNAQHFNIEGEPVQNFVLNNYVSTILNDINAFPTRNDLFETLPHLNDLFSQDSQLLKLDGILFDKDGNRKDSPLKVVIVEGSTKTVKNSTKGTATSNLSISDRRMQEFNQNLNGVYYVLMPADSKTEWSMRLGHYINFSEFNNKGALANKINSIFRKYVATELALAKDAANRKYITNLSPFANRLRFFKDILSAETVTSANEAIDSTDPNSTGIWLEANKDKVSAEINKWIDNRVDAQISNLEEYRALDIRPESAEVGQNIYLWRGLDSEFAKNAEVSKLLTESQIRDIIRFRTLNYVINNIEMHKVLFGDPALYKDATKRIKSFLSGREVTYNTDPEFNLFANDELNKAGKIDLMPGDPGYYRFKDYMNTTTVADIKLVGSIATNSKLTADQIDAESKDAIYGDTNEADAQSWATLGAYREMLLKAGARWTDQQEDQFQYDAAYERQARSKRSDQYKYEYKNEALRKQDEELMTTPSPEADLYVLKPIGTGVKGGSTIADMFLDKTSTLPISYRLAEGRQMEQIYLQMVSQDKQYLIAISGRKVGAEGTHSMYNADGSINESPFNNNVQVPFKYWGIQVETGTHKDKQTRGSQLTKLSVIDLLSAGVPIDVKDSLDQWVEKTEEERRASSGVYSLTQKNKQLLESMTNRGYQNILNRLGIIENEEGFNIPDYKKVVDYIRSEIDRRELPDNIRDSITVNPSTGEMTIPLEALNNYKILKNIIYSIVDKNLLSPKVSGGPKVQVSSTLFEENKRSAVYRDGDKWIKVKDYDSLTDEQKKTVRLTSSDLKFYTPEEPWIEVLVPHWFKDKILEHYKKNNKTGPIPSDKELLAYLKDSPLLKAIGFRIPTQALSSVENIRIKGFLPQSYGSSVVVPSEITSKAGSDFDIDKLNIYLRNFRINAKGMPQHIDMELRDVDPSTEKGRRALYNRFFGRSSDIVDMLNEADASNSLINSIFGIDNNDIADILDLTPQQTEEYNALLEKYIPFSKFEQIVEGKSIYDIYAMFDPKAVENEYYENLNELLSLPQNFKRLIQPNSAKELEDLRNELLQAQGLEKSDVKGNYSVLLDPMFMSQVRHNFISGKGGVGIAAVQQTNNPLSQAAVLVVNHRNFKEKLNSIERSMVPNVTVLLPHNTVTIKGESYTTLSKTLNQLGEYISDKISSYINGYVDVAKDAFIIELGADLNVASTYMFLEKIGVPTKDVIFFMNQPIIRELLKTMQINGLKNPNTWTVQKKITSEVRGMFPTKGPRSGLLDTASFKTNIEKYRDQKKGLYRFTEEENSAQQQILDEFFKYYVMASHLFKVTQGSNYDTANFNEPALVYRKQRATENARYKSIISSVDSILNTSFIGNTAEKLIKVKGAIGTIFKLDDPAVAPIIESVLDPYVAPDKFLSEADYLGIANKVQASFIDWITQTLGEGKLGSRLKALLIDQDTSVANQLFRLKKELPTDSDILNNPVFKQLEASYDNSYSTEVKIITLLEKANDAPTANMYTDAFRELRENPHTTELYHGLVYAAILQSGIRKSPISFTDLIPAEDYSPILSTVMQNLGTTPDLSKFANMHVFQRNNWSDDTIVPEAIMKKRYIDDPQDPDAFIQEGYRVIPGMSNVQGSNGYSFIKLHSLKDSRLTGYPVVKVGVVRVDPETEEEYTKEKMESMRKRGDYSFKAYMLYTPIMTTITNGEQIPLMRADTSTPGASFIYYKQINAWGTPGRVQEYYSTPAKSILPSNYKTNELSDTDILNAISNPIEAKNLLQEQSNEIKYQEDYLDFEEVNDNGSTEPLTLLEPAEPTITDMESRVREDVANAPFDVTEEDINKILKDKDNCKGN
jgi:hypothetical protein